MIKSIIALFIIICAFPQLGSAQINLVYNGSFEEIRKCPDNRKQIMYANHWHSLDSLWAFDTSSSWANIPSDVPALFTSCGSYPFGSTPVNANFYFHNARTGSNMVQFITYRNNDSTISRSIQREHAQVALRQTLIAGRQYCVTFHISLEQLARYASNMIGAYLDDGTIDTVQWPRQGSLTSTTCIPQVYDTTIYTDTLNWHRVQGLFTATGTEKFITIANFFDNTHTDTLGISIPTPLYPSGGGDRVYGYYLLDDVSVIESNTIAYAGSDTSLTAESDSVWVGNHDGYVPCRWYTISGTLIDSNVGGFKVKPGVTTLYIMELDVCGHITRDTVTVFVGPAGVATSPFPSKGGVTCYPNPARDEVTLEVASAKGLTMTDYDVVFYDVVGRAVLHTTLVQQRQVIDVSKLAHGLYTVQLMHTITGEKSTLKFVVE